MSGKFHFKEGHKGYKPKGALSRTTIASRELFVKTLEGEVKYIKKAFEDVRKNDPAKYLELFCKYAQFFVPKKVEVDSTVDLTSVMPVFQFIDNKNED